MHKHRPRNYRPSGDATGRDEKPPFSISSLHGVTFDFLCEYSMSQPYNARELEFLARLRAWARVAREGLKRMQQDGFITRESAQFVAMSVDDALLVAAVADHMTAREGDAHHTCSELERRRLLVSALLKPLP
jgi:hypothetical protein